MLFRKLVLCIFLLYIVLITNAQVIGGSNTKLEKLYNEGKYENCLLKADGMTYKEDYAKDPEPYLYISMCFYQLSKSEDPDIQSDYKDAFKDAIKNAAKFAKKDKKDELYSQNITFINQLKEDQSKIIKEDLDQKSYSRAATDSKTYNRLNREDDPVVLYLTGMTEILSNNMSQGTNDIQAAKEQLVPQLKAGTYNVDPNIKSVLIDVFLAYAQALITDNKKSEAKEALQMANQMLPNTSSLSEKLNEISSK